MQVIPGVDFSYIDGCEVWAEHGASVAKAHWSECIVRSLFSGFYLNCSFSLGVRAMVQSGGHEILFGIFFSVGLIFITLTDSFLFTHDVASVSLAWGVGLTRGKHAVRALFIIFIFNFIGSILGAFFYGYACEFYDDPTDPTRQAIIALGINKASLGYMALLSRATFCNWMVCLAHFLQSRTQSCVSKAVCVLLPISAFASLGLEHGIVNMSILTMCLFLDPNCFSVGNYFKNLSFSVIGNCVGGIVFMSLPAYYTIWWHRKDRGLPKRLVMSEDQGIVAEPTGDEL